MENQSNNKVFTYLLAIFFAIFVGSGIFLLMNNKKTTGNQEAVSNSTIQQQNLIIPSAAPTRGFINLENNSTVNTMANPVELNLLANSDTENITAFDTIVSFDPDGFDFVRVDSLGQDFKIYSYQEGNHLTFTVVKITDNSLETILTGQVVGRLVFQPKIKGNFTFSVLSSFGKGTTKFINEKTEVIYPALNEIKVAID